MVIHMAKDFKQILYVTLQRTERRRYVDDEFNITDAGRLALL